MDWSKVDAGLAAALADGPEGARFAVFVHLVEPLDPDEVDVLGIDGLDDADQGLVRTAVVDRGEVDTLTEQPWIDQLRLSRVLRPFRPS